MSNQDVKSRPISGSGGAPGVSRPLHVGKPSWLKTKIPTGPIYFDIKKSLRDRKLVTVCEEAKCPNIGECWNRGTATFMVLGDTCTRACRFCHVKTGNPQGWLDQNEPRHVAESCQKLGLKYVVITMVDRDDLEDGGASHVAQVIKKTQDLNPGIKIELLAGDFQNKASSIQSILDTRLEVFAHNLETVRSLSPRVRDGRASYDRSLDVLALAKDRGAPGILTKSALMLGLGETRDEVVTTLRDMREREVDFVTLGQYMRPTKKHLSIKRFVHPDEFADFEKIAYELGFKSVASGPLVRSSYKAETFYFNAQPLPKTLGKEVVD